jgi:hypothetical protein
MHLNYLGLILLFLLAACSEPPPVITPPPPDVESPKLSLAGETSRVVTGASVTLEGQLGSDATSFIYRLNGGEAKDVLASVVEGAFKIVIEGLAPGTTTITLEATDAAGNKTVSEAVTVVLVDLNGTWGSQQALYRICTVRVKTALVLKLASGSDGFTGSLTTGFGGDYKVSPLTFQLSETGLVEAPVSFPSEFQGEPAILGSLRLQLKDMTLTAQLVYNDGQRCNPNDETPQDVVVEATLKKDVDVPPPPPDDTLEPNNDQAQASDISLTNGKDLVLVYKNRDWFKIVLTGPSIIKMPFTTTQRGAGATLRLYDARGLVGEAFQVRSTTKPENQAIWGVAAGTYYLEVQGYPYPITQASMPYRLSFSAVVTPDAPFEPNDSAAKAFNITLPFRANLYLQEKDQDWFKFTLQKESSLTFGAIVAGSSLYNSSLKLIATDQDFFFLEPLLPGTYYLKIEELGGAIPYTLSLSAKPVPVSVAQP